MSKALFLDRDGIVNVEKNYVYRIDDFEFIEGIFTLTRIAQEKGYLLVIITNQAGIARGYYTEDEFQELTRWMLNQFLSKGVNITKVYHCPYHETAGIGRYKRASFDRKPNPGMLFKARDEFQIDLPHSILVGDKRSDMEAGRNAGVGRLVMLADKSSETHYMQGVDVVYMLSDIKEILCDEESDLKGIDKIGESLR